MIDADIYAIKQMTFTRKADIDQEIFARSQ